MVDASEKPRWRGWIVFAGAILAVTLIVVVFPIERSCVSLLAAGEPPMMLPKDCTLERIPPSEQRFENLEAERLQRGLKREGWIECAPTANARAWLNSLETDRRWLPSYVPGAYEWRRTVIVVGGGPASATGTQVIGEVCLMPWRRYIQLIRGECGGKFAVWK